MLPDWAQLVEQGKVTPIAAEAAALERLAVHGIGNNPLPAGYWEGLGTPLEAVDFSDFLVLVRSDMPEDVARLLTWCLVERREGIERLYRHLPPKRSPVSYPLDPARMGRTSIALHPGARAYFDEAGWLAEDRLTS
jgi:TRAP-type uncharacterized transport system substrate-binding protein